MGITEGLVVGVSDGNVVGVDEGESDGSSEVDVVGGEDGLVEGDGVVAFVLTAVGASVGATIGGLVGRVPTSSSMACFTESQTVKRLLVTKSERAGSKVIIAFGPTQQFGV